MNPLMDVRVELFLIVLLGLPGAFASARANPAPSKMARLNGGTKSATLASSGLTAPREGGGTAAKGPAFVLKTEQLAFGAKHHFFGYIGQCRAIPWNAGGRYILGMEIDRIDRMPDPSEAATRWRHPWAVNTRASASGAGLATRTRLGKYPDTHRHGFCPAAPSFSRNPGAGPTGEKRPVRPGFALCGVA